MPPVMVPVKVPVPWLTGTRLRSTTGTLVVVPLEPATVIDSLESPLVAGVVSWTFRVLVSPGFRSATVGLTAPAGTARWVAVPSWTGPL